MPEWFNYDRAMPQSILAGRLWHRSYRHCRGLFTLSRYLADWLAARVDVPVSPLLHPTEFPERRFSLEAYRANPDKALVQVGWWLRRFPSLYRLPVRRLRRLWLDVDAPWVRRARADDLKSEGYTPHDEVERRPFLADDAYDELLSRNLVFLHLHDASANNALIECIARATPVLVNPLPAVQEYLGRDYPFYFTTLEEAARKAESDEHVAATHLYLRKLPLRERLTAEYFLHSFRESHVMRSLGVLHNRRGRR